MTRPYERWPTLWQLFIALDEDCFDTHADEDAALQAELTKIGTSRLERGLAEWQQAIGSTTDEELAAIVADFNPSYDPTEKFGGYRGWAEWVRENLERELTNRKVSG